MPDPQNTAIAFCLTCLGWPNAEPLALDSNIITSHQAEPGDQRAGHLFFDYTDLNVVMREACAWAGSKNLEVMLLCEQDGKTFIARVHRPWFWQIDSPNAECACHALLIACVDAAKRARDMEEAYLQAVDQAIIAIGRPEDRHSVIPPINPQDVSGFRPITAAELASEYRPRK